jgi:hypothetical protein
MRRALPLVPRRAANPHREILPIRFAPERESIRGVVVVKEDIGDIPDGAASMWGSFSSFSWRFSIPDRGMALTVTGTHDS